MVNAPLALRATQSKGQNSVGEASMKISKRQWCLLLCAVVSGVGGACADGVTPLTGSPLCPQSQGEFGSYGCAVVAGQVLGANGSGLPGATVSVVGSERCVG